MLDDRQVTELANIFVNMADSIREFYDDPQNKKEYQDWYLKKYGRLPEEV